VKGNELQEIYENRFSKDIKERDTLWKVLCKGFFQKYIYNKEGSILDIGAGYCEFINNIDCKEKFAIDLNNDVVKYASKNVKVINDNCLNIDKHFKEGSLDHVFMSNFLEHLLSKSDVVDIIKKIHRLLKKGGRLLILQPNIKYLYREYWDYFDHNIPISDKSLTEVLEFSGFKILKCLPKFLPYTTKSKFPKTSLLVWLYLKLPFAFNIFGRQVFVVAEKK
jgi:SAM-dependent methyltransferase